MSTRRINRGGKTRVSASLKLLFTLAVVAALIGQMMLPAGTTVSAAGTSPAAPNLNSRPVPNYDINLTKYSLRLPSSAQVQALDAESVTAAIQPNTAYVYRVVGWLGVAQDFQLVSTQTLRVPRTGTTASTSPSTGLMPYVRFSVNPLTGAVIAQLLQ